MDSAFLSLVHATVDYVDDRFGRAAAWTTTVLMLTVGFALVAMFSLWVIGLL
jgi:hypothetical protein